MVWIYLAESADSPSPWHPGLNQSPTVKMTDTLNLCCFQAWLGVTCPWLPYGTMCEHFEQALLARPKSTSYTVDSHARTSVLQGLAQDWKESEAFYFGKSFGCVANLSVEAPNKNPLLYFWKTSQQSLLEVETRWLQPLPKWGMTVDGALYPLRKLGRTIKENAGFYLPTPDTGMRGGTIYDPKGKSQSQRTLQSYVKTFPTPTAQDAKNSTLPPSQRNRDTLPGHMIRSGQKPGGQLNPMWVEWLMGYPIGWTELKDWAMQSYRSKRGKRSKH